MVIYKKAILLGYLADLLATFLIAAVLDFGFGVNARDPNLYLWSIGVGVVAGVFGGLVTSRVASSSKLANAGLLGACQVAIGVAVGVFVHYPLWFNLVGAILAIPVALIGAYLDLAISGGKKVH